MMINRTGYLVAFTALSIAAAFLVPAMPQPVEYHDFADQRSLFGIANFFDVASNAGFLLVGVAGLFVVLKPRTPFEQNSERWPYAIFFVGTVLTALGSGYYHLLPDNEHLFWDRLPMTIAFMSLIAAQIVDRINTRAGIVLLLPMLLIGAASVVYWLATERSGAGNVVPYAILQGYAVLILLAIAWLYPSRYTRGNDIYWSLCEASHSGQERTLALRRPGSAVAWTADIRPVEVWAARRGTTSAPASQDSRN